MRLKCLFQELVHLVIHPKASLVMGLLTKSFISYSICFVFVTFKQIYISIHLCIFYICCWINTVNLKRVHTDMCSSQLDDIKITFDIKLWSHTRGTSYETNTGAHTLRCNCTNTNTYLHSGLKPLTGIHAAVYWHKPWLQCSVVKSCRADLCLILICSFFLID